MVHRHGHIHDGTLKHVRLHSGNAGPDHTNEHSDSVPIIVVA